VLHAASQSVNGIRPTDDSQGQYDLAVAREPRPGVTVCTEDGVGPLCTLALAVYAGAGAGHGSQLLSY